MQLLLNVRKRFCSDSNAMSRRQPLLSALTWACRAVSLPVLMVAMWMAFTTPSALAAGTRNVLVLYSSARLLPANIEGEHGLSETLASPIGGLVDLYSEFLDIPRFEGVEYERAFAAYLHDKYAARQPDIIIAAGEQALRFLLRDRARLFPLASLIHMGVNRSALQALPELPADAIGAPIDFDFAATVDQALRWHPAARKLVLVTGTSERDRNWEARMRAEAIRFANRVEIEYLIGLPTATLLKRLAQLPRDAIVFTPGYFQDRDGRNTMPQASVAAMAAVASAPIYGPFNTFIGTGAVGGRMPNFTEMGRQAGTLANALLSGASPASLAPVTPTPAQMQVDWRQVVRWGIAPSAIPPDTIEHFKEPTFWEQHRDTALAGASLMLLQAGLIAWLLAERHRRQRVTAALARSEQQMNLAAHAARLSMWSWDDRRKTARVNPPPAAPTPTQPRATNDIGTPLDRVYAQDRDALERAIVQALEQGKELDHEYRVPGRGGELLWMAARGRADPGDRRQLLGVVFDITQRKRAEHQAERDRAALRHMTRVALLGQLSASIAHQLNQPLASILANAEAAQKVLQREPVDLAELRDICDDIVAEDHRAADVIRRLGALFKQGEPLVVAVDVNALVRETIDLLRTELLTRHVIAETRLAPDLPQVDGDRVQLQQLLLNLFVNAADAMNEIPPAERRLTITTQPAGAFVEVRVADRGPGITATDADSVFEAFWSTKANGMGIGLAICRSIANAHRGSLTMSNAAQGGAVFCALLPVRTGA
jgi:C4-dicarboxylate-specific signal transduction histidine kinase